MPSYFTGSIDDRLARLEKKGLRCDGNSRNCYNPAVDEYDLMPADGYGNMKLNAPQVTKKSCGRHRAQFLGNGSWFVVAERKVDKKEMTEPSSSTSVHVRFNASLAADAPKPTWVDFIHACNEIDDTTFGKPTEEGNWWAGGTFEDYVDARILHRSDRTVSIVARTTKGNNVMKAAAQRLGVHVHV